MSSALLFTFDSSPTLIFFIMIRNKISRNSFSIFKPKTRNINLFTSFSAFQSSSAYRNNFFFNLEANNFFKAFSLYKNFPSIRSNEKYMSHFSEPTCWNCKENLNAKNFTCSLCGALQPPKSNINFFELLGVSQTYDIDLEDMTKKFRDLQMIFHPDKVGNKSENEKLISETYSKLLNKAYTTLKDPVSRGFYLLEFNKVPSKSNYPLDPKFLSTIMETNEELETLDNLSSLSKFLEANNEQIEKHYFTIQNDFRNNKLVDANINLLKLNYLINLNKKIKEKEMKLKSSNEG